MIKNKYPKDCSKCSRHVGIGEGSIQRINDRWITFCNSCLPKKRINDIITSENEHGKIHQFECCGMFITFFCPNNLKQYDLLQCPDCGRKVAMVRSDRKPTLIERVPIT